MHVGEDRCVRATLSGYIRISIAIRCHVKPFVICPGNRDEELGKGHDRADISIEPPYIYPWILMILDSLSFDFDSL